jgi:acyl-CoA synthetase (AMP-forming)/AMP-acid ligase II
VLSAKLGVVNGLALDFRRVHENTPRRLPGCERPSLGEEAVGAASQQGGANRVFNREGDMKQVAAGLIEGPKLANLPFATVPELIRQRARERPAKTALIDAPSGRSYSFGKLDYLIGRFAAGLARQGFRQGDTLVMFLPNVPEWPIAALGAMSAGGVVSGANSMCTASELAYQLRDADARFVVTIPRLLPVVYQAANDAGQVTTIVLGESPEALTFAYLLNCAGEEPTPTFGAQTLAALPYSSGTSGLPKGVMLTHENIVSNVFQFSQASGWPDTAISLAFLPMFHIYGMTVVLLSGLATGMTLVTIPKFEPEQFLQALQEYRVTHLAVVPPVLQFLASHPLVNSYDLSSLQVVGCGAAPLGSALEQKAGERLNCDIGQGYGMTESSGVIAISYPGRYRLGSSGQLLPGTEARVVSLDNGQNVEQGVSGEIWFRGPQAFKGYLNNSEMTRDTIAPDGWVRTGDVGYIDGDGYIFITDRLKELIKVKGFQVAPAELEALLYAHPLVSDAAVIGRTDERDGERPVAYVVRRGELEPNELKNWFAERVSAYKQLADVIVCEEIPKSPSGKILRRVLRARDAQHHRLP